MRRTIAVINGEAYWPAHFPDFDVARA